MKKQLPSPVSRTDRSPAAIIAARSVTADALSYEAFYQCAEHAINEFVCKHYDVSQGDVFKDVQTGEPLKKHRFLYEELRKDLIQVAIGVEMGIPDKPELIRAARQFIDHSNAQGPGRAEALVETLHEALTPLCDQAIALRSASAASRG